MSHSNYIFFCPVYPEIGVRPYLANNLKVHIKVYQVSKFKEMYQPHKDQHMLFKNAVSIVFTYIYMP